MDDHHATAMVLEALLRRLERQQPGLAADIMDELADIVDEAKDAQTPLADNTQAAIWTWGQRLQTISAGLKERQR